MGQIVKQWKWKNAAIQAELPMKGNCTYIEIVSWETFFSFDKLDTIMGHCQVLDINILVTSCHRVDSAEVDIHLPCQADQVHLGEIGRAHV